MATGFHANLDLPPLAMMPVPHLMKLIPLLCLSLLASQSAKAGGPDCSKSMTGAVAETDPFMKGGHEVIFSGGFLYSPMLGGHGRPVLNYAQSDLSLGWMLTSPSPLFNRNWLRGNWEGLANVFGAKVTEGPDGFLGGARALMRYNFVQPESRWVPFCQLGVGGLGDDVYRHRDQRVIGSGFEFTLVADCGLRYFFTKQWAALVMIDFEHISNADTASRNVGVNAAGGTAGIGCFF